MSLLAFAFAAVVLAVTPGPGIAYVVARTVAGGRAEGLASCLGTGLGGMLHVLAAALGLSLIVAQSALAFAIVKYLGAAYLIYLGIRLLLRGERRRGGRERRVERRAPRLHRGHRGRGAQRQDRALLPRLPAAVRRAREPLMPQLVLLGSICVVLNTLVDVVAVFAADRLLASGVARAARARLISRISGTTLLGLGAWLALAKRPT
jgi:threonine/homoserine/homoserine lactone efflux protein